MVGQEEQCLLQFGAVVAVADILPEGMLVVPVGELGLHHHPHAVRRDEGCFGRAVRVETDHIHSV